MLLTPFIISFVNGSAACTYIHRLHQHLGSNTEFALPFLVAIDIFPGFASGTTQVCRPITHHGTVFEMKLVHPVHIFASQVYKPVGDSTDGTELWARYCGEWVKCDRIYCIEKVVSNNARQSNQGREGAD